MSEFLYLFRGWEAPASPDEAQQQILKWSTWFKELAAKGHIKDRGHPLERGGKVLKGKKGAVTDGPYAETKDFVGGYTVIEARDLAHASELASGCPVLETGGAVEIRPILSLRA